MKISAQRDQPKRCCNRANHDQTTASVPKWVRVFCPRVEFSIESVDFLCAWRSRLFVWFPWNWSHSMSQTQWWYHLFECQLLPLVSRPIPNWFLRMPQLAFHSLASNHSNWLPFVNWNHRKCHSPVLNERAHALHLHFSRCFQIDFGVSMYFDQTLFDFFHQRFQVIL